MLFPILPSHRTLLLYISSTYTLQLPKKNLFISIYKHLYDIAIPFFFLTKYDILALDVAKLAHQIQM